MKAAATPHERLGVVATDPLRVLGVQAIFAEDRTLEVVHLSVPGALQDTNLSLVLIDAQCTDHLFELLATFRHARRQMKLIVLGVDTDLDYVQRVIGAGAKGYLTLGAQESEICQAVSTVRDGSIWAPRRVLANLLDQQQAAPLTAPSFTVRELQVVKFLQAGYSNREIGLELGIDEGTVKAHVGRLMRKVGVSGRVALSTHPLLQPANLGRDSE